MLSQLDVMTLTCIRTIRFHPDKVSAADRPAAEARFVHLKIARDVLTDPVKRFAYDRFGPDILDGEIESEVGERGTWFLILIYHHGVDVCSCLNK